MIRDRLFCSTEAGGAQVSEACMRAVADARARGWAPAPPRHDGMLAGPWVAAGLAVLLVAALAALLVLAVRRPAGSTL